MAQDRCHYSILTMGPDMVVGVYVKRWHQIIDIVRMYHCHNVPGAMYPSPGRSVPFPRQVSPRLVSGNTLSARASSHLVGCRPTLTGDAASVAVAHHILVKKIAHSTDMCDKTYMC